MGFRRRGGFAGAIALAAVALLGAVSADALSVAQTTTTAPPLHDYPSLGVYVHFPDELPLGATTFVVHLKCGPAGGPLTHSQDLEFTWFPGANVGRNALPPTGYPYRPNQDEVCSVNQTQDGGATSVAYSCLLSGQPDSQFCQPSGDEAHFDATGNSQSVVNLIVLDTFTSPKATLPPPIATAPSFTG